MNSVLYHQMKKVIQGKDVYLGEDAYPYASDDLIIVSDGLGGRGGYHHKRFVHDILEQDKIYDILFAPVFEKEVSDDIKSFIIDSFSELYKTRDYYFTMKETMKCSGYFASRIITAIALYELRYNDEFEKSKLFSVLRTANAEKRELLAQEYGDKLASCIERKLKKIAECGNFMLESSFTGAYLLPATLTVALMNEMEDSVDVLYLWAGDSRAYLYDKNGLAQITEDQENNEVMTNLITLSKPFRVEGHFTSFAKPCVVFNASDGIYKSYAFESPVDLEFEIIRTTLNLGGSFDITPTCFDEAMKNLSSDLLQIGKHDDSNTIALSTFGFSSFEEIKNMLSERFSYIESDMLSQLPELFSRSFSRELQNKEYEREDQLLLFKDEFIKDNGVREYIAEKLADKYKPIEDEYIEEVVIPDDESEFEDNPEKDDNSDIISDTDILADDGNVKESHSLDLGETPAENADESSHVKEIAELTAEEKMLLEEKIRSFIKSNWLIGPVFRKYGILRNTPVTDERILKSLLSELEAAKISKDTSITEIESKLKAFNDRIASAECFVVDSLFKGFLKTATYYKDAIEESLEFKRLVYRYHGLPVSEIADSCDTISNHDAVDLTDAPTVEKSVEPKESKNIIAEEKSDEEIDVEEVDTEKTEAVKKQVPIVRLVKRVRKPIEYVPEDAIITYWMRNYRKELNAIWSEKKDIISDELLAKVTEKVARIEEEYKAIKESYDIREQIYEEYDKNYRRSYRRTKI